MKKLLLIVFGIFLFSTGFGQTEAKEKSEAIELVKSNKANLGLSDKDIINLEVSSTYISSTSGARMVYVNQTYLGSSIHNQMLVLAFKNDKLISQSGAFITNANQIAVPQSGLPVVSVQEALRSVLVSLSLNTKITSPTPEIRGEGPGATYYHFGNLAVSEVDVVAHLVWVPISSKKLSLSWEFEIAPLGTSDHWMIRVDAIENKILDKNNYTVFEHLNTQDNHNESSELSHNVQVSQLQNAPSVVTSASYKVIPFSAESPLHANGTAALVNNPWTLAAGNATSLGWHFDGTTYHDSTRGNNVWAQEDRDNNNNTFGKTAISSTAQPGLTFDYPVDYTQAPTTTDFQRFATANLFYWSNLIHDITYIYGFNEAAGNFQNNNQNRGGLGNDYVIADAQDGGGTNNANFSTPVDGSRPRMQMYLSTFTTPNRDGDLDNGVVAHEYGHGLSNRLTGGPSNSSCLGNAEQGGEGWSDYLALMLTTNWTNATVNDGSLARPIGTYLFGQAPTGNGIRTYPYSTNMSINPNTYSMMATSSGVHRIGEIWCSALWDMTWEIIALDGINTNIFNPGGNGGNSVALKLVIEGMRLQPCSPGYIDARNAILRADTILYGGRYGCAIWKAFARRGMGKFASQGSSSSTTDQTADFTDNGGITFSTTQSVTQQIEGQEITYTHRVGSGTCSGISNYIIRDTLPANVTYVSGGAYDAATRVVSFPVNLGVAQTQTYSFVVSINAGSYFPPVQLIDETVPSASISGFWTTSSTTTTNWTTTNTRSTSAPNALFTANLASVSDQKIETTNPILIPSNPPLLSFQGFINSEASWDGGVVEISNNNGTTWTDLGSAFVSGRYTGNLSASTNPLTGRAAFHGNSGGFVKTTINLNAYAGQSVKIRFRFGSDASVAATGWYIDDVQMKSEARVNISGLLFNQNNVRVASIDTFTIILPTDTGCNTANISSQPAAMNVCREGNASTSVAATGTDLVYQWQVSTDGGLNFSDMPGETSNTYQTNNVTDALNGNVYRCEINGACTDKLLSGTALLTVNALPNPPEVFGASRCGTGTTILTATSTNEETVNWFALSSGGNSIGTGASFTTPTISSTTTYYAESRNTITGCVSIVRGAATATVLSAPAAPAATGSTACAPGAQTLNASTAVGNTINWYSAATGGTLLAQNTNTFTTPVISTTTAYFVESNNGTCSSTTRTAVTASITSGVATIATFTNATKCGPDTTSLFATATAGNTVDWYADSLGTVLLQSGTATGSNKFITPVLSATTNYWAYQRSTSGGCRSAASRKVTATMNPKPAAPNANGASRCGTGTLTLTATAPAGGTVAWFNVASGGTSLSTANSYTTASISATTNYFVQSRITATGCISATRSTVAATINAIPSAAVAVPNARCGAGSITVSATPGANQTIDWYSASTGGTLLQSASLSITRTISTTTNYFATARNTTTGCIATSRRSVTATVSTRAPNTPTTLTGLTAICPIVGTATGTNYSTTSVNGALSYVWTVPAGAVIDSGRNGLRIKVRFLRVSANDTIQVQSSNGCLSAKRSLRLTTTGCVTTKFEKGNGFNTTSEVENNFNVYPNPSKGSFQLSTKDMNTAPASIRLINAQGVVLRTWNNINVNNVRFGDDLKAGMYHIEIFYTNGKRGTKTIIKM